MTITAKCACCGREEIRELTAIEEYNLQSYRLGLTRRIQDALPDVPAWIRNYIQMGFGICDDCGRSDEE